MRVQEAVFRSREEREHVRTIIVSLRLRARLEMDETGMDEEKSESQQMDRWILATVRSVGFC